MKAILIVDIDNEKELLNKKVVSISFEDGDKIYDNFKGLIPMPEELITPYMFRQEMIALGLQNEDGTVSVYSEDYMNGWNDCIQALLGEDEWLGEDE